MSGCPEVEVVAIPEAQGRSPSAEAPSRLPFREASLWGWGRCISPPRSVSCRCPPQLVSTPQEAASRGVSPTPHPSTWGLDCPHVVSGSPAL